MIKSFIELSKVEVKATKKPTFKWDKATQKVKETGEYIDVVSWVDTLKTLYENGAERVTFENVINPITNGLLFHDENGAISIKVFVEVDGDRREIYYPVVSGASDIKLDKLTQSDIYKAKQRAFVKCVAVNWGVGIKYWEKDDNADVELVKEETSLAEQFRTIVNSAVKKCGGLKPMLALLDGVTEREIKDLIEKASKMDGIIKILEKTL